MSFTGFFELRKIANRRKRWGALGPRDGTDAVLVVGDVRLPVHSTVLGTLSTFFRGKTGDIVFNGWSIHVVWRTLELIYCQDYTEQPCPKTNMPGAPVFAALLLVLRADFGFGNRHMR
jgi:hypothetical protein